MYTILLTLHSWVRWLVFISVIIALYRAYKGWFSNQVFSPLDNKIRHITATIAHIQLTIGLWLYVISPIIDYFLHNFKVAVHQREIRFFGMEHSFMMLVAIIVITIGSIKAKRKPTDLEKFKTLVIWFTIALIIIFFNIPWAFSPLTSRPLFRGF